MKANIKLSSEQEFLANKFASRFWNKIPFIQIKQGENSNDGK